MIRLRAILARLRPRVSGPELLAALLAAAVALLAAGCERRPARPVVIVDPGPPFHPPGLRIGARHVLHDNSVVVVIIKQ